MTEMVNFMLHVYTTVKNTDTQCLTRSMKIPLCDTWTHLINKISVTEESLQTWNLPLSEQLSVRTTWLSDSLWFTQVFRFLSPTPAIINQNGWVPESSFWTEDFFVLLWFCWICRLESEMTPFWYHVPWYFRGSQERPHYCRTSFWHYGLDVRERQDLIPEFVT